MEDNEEINQQLLGNYNDVIYAVCPEEIFGELTEKNAEAIRADIMGTYNSLLAILDPDVYNDFDERTMAAEAREILKKLFNSAQAKISNGNYGKKVKIRSGNFGIKTDSREYHFQTEATADGDLCLIYAGYCSNYDDTTGQVIAKVVAEAADNVFLENEAACLEIFKKNPGAQNKHLPILLDRFKTGDGRLGLILRRCEVLTLEQIRLTSRRWHNGILDKHVAWMMNRGLSALGYAHLKGVVHCNLAPEHLLITPPDHNMFILDWTGAAYQRTQPFRFVREGFSPPEVAEKKSLPIPASDIYAFGKCMIYALGGNEKSGEMPNSVHPGLQNFLAGFIMESPIQRPDDAWKLHHRLSILRKQWWGPDKFLKFEI